jgi:hypothetical protein
MERTIKIETKEFWQSVAWTNWLRPGLKVLTAISCFVAGVYNFVSMILGFTGEFQGFDHPFVCMGFAIFFFIIFGLCCENWCSD